VIQQQQSQLRAALRFGTGVCVAYSREQVALAVKVLAVEHRPRSDSVTSWDQGGHLSTVRVHLQSISASRARVEVVVFETGCWCTFLCSGGGAPAFDLEAVDERKCSDAASSKFDGTPFYAVSYALGVAVLTNKCTTSTPKAIRGRCSCVAPSIPAHTNRVLVVFRRARSRSVERIAERHKREIQDVSFISECCEGLVDLVLQVLLTTPSESLSIDL
jgi:hypothetical protein